MSAPGPHSPFPSPESSSATTPPVGDEVANGPRRRNPFDVAVTVLLIVVLAGLGLFALMVGLYSGMASDGCFGDQACLDGVTRGVLLLLLAPIAAWVPTTVWAIVRLVRRKVAFWVPLIAVPVYLVLAALALTFFDS